MNVLVLNAGSLTLKFQLVRTDADRMATDSDEKLARGTVGPIGGEAVYSIRGQPQNDDRGTAELRDHRAAIEFVLRWLVRAESGSGLAQIGEIDAVGHRVTHGALGAASRRQRRLSAAAERG
ncbi:MAG: hypothetical protein ABR499_22880 [Gemmatimonadaceae bacterium]